MFRRHPFIYAPHPQPSPRPKRLRSHVTGPLRSVTAAVVLLVCALSAAAQAAPTRAVFAPTVTGKVSTTTSAVFCGSLRTYFVALSEGRFAFLRLESANAKAFNQRAAATIPTLLASAPPSRTDDVKVTTNYAHQLFAVLDKAKYDFRKLDPKTSEIIANMGGTAEIAAEASLKAYAAQPKTCNVDLNKAVDDAIQAEPKTSKKKP